MKITKIRYGRIVNIGNYENQRLELESEVMDGETPAEIYAGLKTYAEILLGIEGASASAEEYAKAKKLVRAYEKHRNRDEDDDS